MPVFLLVLKWIGIVLGALVGGIVALILVIALVLLFAPVFYSGKATKEGDDISVRFRVHWLWPVLSVTYGLTYGESGLHHRLCVRLFGYPFKDTGRKPKIKKVKEKKEAKEKAIGKKDIAAESEEVLADTEGAPDIAVERTGSVAERVVEAPAKQIEPVSVDTSLATTAEHADSIAETLVEPPESTLVDENTASPVEGAERETRDTDSDRQSQSPDLPLRDSKLSIRSRIAAFIRTGYKKLLSIVTAAKNTVQAIVAKLADTQVSIEEKRAKIERYLDFFLSKKHKKLYAREWKLIKKILLHILPRRVRGRVDFGTGDAYDTTNILIPLSAVYGLYGSFLSVYPHYDTKVFDANLTLRGHITLCPILILGLKAYNKKLKKFIKKAKALKEAA